MDPQQIPAESGPQKCTKLQGLDSLVGSCEKHVAFHISEVQKLSKYDLKHRDHNNMGRKYRFSFQKNMK